MLVGDVLATTADVLFYCFRGSSANISHVTQTLLLVDVTSDSRSCSKESWILCVCPLPQRSASVDENAEGTKFQVKVH